MKRITTLLAALFLCLGLAQAQDVYVSGNHFTTGKVFKNNTLLYSITDSIDVQLRSIQVAEDGTVYGAGYAYNSSDSYGYVWMNDSCIFVADTNTYFEHIVLNGNDWTVAGFNNVWQNGELLYSYTHGDEECHIHGLAVDTTTGDIYAGGAIYSGEYPSYASIWKNDSLLWMEDTISSIESICFDGENLYASGFRFENDSLYYGVIWQNDSIIYQMENANFGFIAAYNGSLYWSGISLTDSIVYIWQDGEVLYDLPELSGISNLVVNENGVYYTDAQTVYKDGEVLYQPDECIISGLVVLPAEAPQPTFTLTVEVDSIGGGTVTGGGTYYYGDTATIEAFPDMGCEFLFWNDGIITNPRDIIITQDTTFIAHFNFFEYTINAEVIPMDAGTVTGGGTYHYGDTITLEAFANDGYEFEQWTDSITDNPRDVIVTQDSTFIAMFTLRQFTIEVVSNHPEWGSVSGGGTFYYGDTIQIEATPNLGYVFTGWGDANSDNPRTVIVTEDHTYTAHFNIQQCIISTDVTPADAGTVTGAGAYYYGDRVTLTAIENTGYTFARWDDGNTDNPREIIVEGDATYIAVFIPMQYEITTECDPVEGGTVNGAGTYDYGSIVTLTAIPNDNYTFLCWSDGIVSNPRNITVTGNANYKAMFHLSGTPQYTITVVANNPLLGTVTGGGTYDQGTVIEISATPNTGAIFTGWDDGNTDNPRSVTVTQNMEFMAMFAEVETYTITVRPENPLQGTTYGSGQYTLNEVVTIGATPSLNFYFTGWQDGDMNNPRTIIVTGDAEYIASFSQNPVETYTVTVYYDEAEGFILGAGTYMAGATASIAAIPADGYYFKKWSDGTNDNPKEILVDHDITLAAFFEGTGVDENGFEIINLYPNPASDKIHIEGLEGEHEVQIYNAFGMLVMTTTLEGDSEINICDLPAGYYLIRIDNRRAEKFIKENK